MDLRQLSYFATIVEEGTITGAARKLHISQPPLSHQMHLLEKELDAVLFIRGARQIKLTEPGIALYRYAMEMLELEQVAKDEITSLTSGARGSIRLGLVSSSASPGLYRCLARFHKIFPDVSLKVYEGNTFELLDMLEKAKLKWLSSEPLFPVTVWISPRFSMTTWSLPGLLNSLMPKIH